MTVNIFPTVDELLDALATQIVTIAKHAIAERGVFNIALSGGHSPEQLYSLLASPKYRQQIEWEKVHFFFGDERYVPANDPKNNSHMAERTLFNPLNIPPSNIFSVDTSLTPDEAAKSYTETIVHHLNKDLSFDLILLGLGDNAHTASLFPFTSVLAEQSATVQAVFVEEQDAYRITMTAPLINRARHIAFLVYGEGKSEAVEHVLEGQTNFEKYPAQLINPSAGDVQWYLDEAAAFGLKNQIKR